MCPVDGEVSEVIKDFRSHLGGRCVAIIISTNDRGFSTEFTTRDGILDNVITSGIIDNQDKVLSLAKKMEIAQKKQSRYCDCKWT